MLIQQKSDIDLLNALFRSVVMKTDIKISWQVFSFISTSTVL